MGEAPVNATPLSIKAAAEGCTFFVRVHPGAKRNTFVGIHDGAVKLSLTTPPTDGKANTALIAFLAEQLNIARTCLEITSGTTSRSKTLRVRGLTVEVLERKLRALLCL